MHRKALMQLLRSYRNNWLAETKMAHRLIDFVVANTVSNESHDLAWIDSKRLAEVTTEQSMLRMARKWLVR